MLKTKMFRFDTHRGKIMQSPAYLSRSWLIFIKNYQVANKVDVFNKLKEIHHRIGTSVPQILVSQVARELALSQEELGRHLDGLAAMDLLKFKGTTRGAVELTRSGATSTLKVAAPKPTPVSDSGNQALAAATIPAPSN